MKQSKAQAYVRQLCCLGLSREIMISELLRALHSLIPSEDNFFAGLDQNYSPAYVLAEQFTFEALDVYLNQPAQLFTPEYNVRAVQWFTAHRVLPDFRILDDRFYQRDFYHLVLRLNNHHYALQGTVYQDGRVVGMIVLCRPPNQSPFNTSHRQQFEQMLPYLDHGLQVACSAIDQDYVDSGRSGLVILNRDGTIVSLSKAARTLLFLATYGALPAGQIQFSRAVAMPPALRQVCARLDRIFQEQDAPPPVSVETNAGGRFIFRAHWLEPLALNTSGDGLGVSPAAHALIGVTIDHQEPLRLRLCRAMRGSRLSIREQGVCLALADNLSYPAIAARLHLSPSTVVTYIRRIHEKLGTNSREELLKTLLPLDK